MPSSWVCMVPNKPIKVVPISSFFMENFERRGVNYTAKQWYRKGKVLYMLNSELLFQLEMFGTNQYWVIPVHWELMVILFTILYITSLTGQTGGWIFTGLVDKFNSEINTPTQKTSFDCGILPLRYVLIIIILTITCVIWQMAQKLPITCGPIHNQWYETRLLTCISIYCMFTSACMYMYL